MIRSALLDRIKGSGPASLSSPTPFGSGIYGERYEPETRRDFVEAYRDRGWVQRCINYVATAVDSVPVKAWRGPLGDAQKSKEVEESQLLKLLDRPNPRDPAQRFFSTSAKWAQTIGEWYWELVPSRGGFIAEAYPLRGHLVQIIPDQAQAGRIAKFVYDPNETGEKVELKAADPMAAQPRPEAGTAIYGRFANPFDDYYGMAPLRGAKDDVISEYYAIRYDQRFFRNSARPDVILAFEKEMGKEDREANQEAWKEFKGVDRAHKAAVLNGKVAVTELGKSQRDVQYLEGRKLAREGECGALGVPPVLVGILDHATYSNYKEAGNIFWRSTMIPLLDFLASWANWSLVPFFDDVDWISFDTSGVEALQEDEGERMDRLAKGVTGGFLMPWEARDELDLGEIEGTKVLMAPMSLVPYTGDDYEEPEPPPQLRPADGQTVDGQAVDVTEPPPQLPPGKGRKVGAAQATRYMQLRASAVQAAARGGVRVVEKAMKAQETEVLSLLTGGGKAKAAEVVHALEARDWGKDAQRLEAAVSKVHLQTAKFSGAHAEALLGITVHFGGDNPALGQILNHLAGRPNGIRSTAGRIKEEVIEEVRQGIASGLTHEQIAQGGTFSVAGAGAEEAQVTVKGIRGVFAEYKTWQAVRIARTEAATAYNVSSAAWFRDAGVQEVDIIDGDDDDECGAANGSRWTLDEYDSNPLEHPNCTRIGLPVVEE